MEVVEYGERTGGGGFGQGGVGEEWNVVLSSFRNSPDLVVYPEMLLSISNLPDQATYLVCSFKITARLQQATHVRGANFLALTATVNLDSE